MARTPSDGKVEGFMQTQGTLLERVKFHGNNNWTKTPQTSELMPKLLAQCAQEGLSLDQIVEAMRAEGFSPRALRQLKRWEKKRTTGKLGQ